MKVQLFLFVLFLLVLLHSYDAKTLRNKKVQNKKNKINTNNKFSYNKKFQKKANSPIPSFTKQKSKKNHKKTRK